MKCTKCGFIGFDHVSTCTKCGKDLTEVRQELNLWDFAPVAPAFLVEAILSLAQRAGAATADIAHSPAGAGAGEALDLLGEIDLKVDMDAQPEEITLELLDEGEESLAVPEPVGAEDSSLSLEKGMDESPSTSKDEPLGFEQGLEALDLKIELDDQSIQELDVVDGPKLEGEVDVVESLQDEELSDEALERLRRELESADELLKDIEVIAPETDRPPIGSTEALDLDLDLGDELTPADEPVRARDEDRGIRVETPDENEDEDVFILMEERDGGLAVQEFALDEGPSKEEPSEERSEEPFVLDLDALTEEPESKPKKEEKSAEDEVAVDGLVLELEDGFYIEPDEDEEK